MPYCSFGRSGKQRPRARRGRLVRVPAQNIGNRLVAPPIVGVPRRQRQLHPLWRADEVRWRNWTQKAKKQPTELTNNYSSLKDLLYSFSSNSPFPLLNYFNSHHSSINHFGQGVLGHQSLHLPWSYHFCIVGGHRVQSGCSVLITVCDQSCYIG